MRYKPKFCCNCGEKIDRPNPSFTDSKMFCDVCKHDFVLPRAAPVVFVSLMALIGLFGVGGYWRGGAQPVPVSSRQFAANPANDGKRPANQTPPGGSNSNAPPLVRSNNAPPARSSTNNFPAKDAKPAPVRTDVPVYFCGAETKKGTPCSRRVRGGGRCWQHQGLAALLPDEKLAVSQ